MFGSYWFGHSIDVTGRISLPVQMFFDKIRFQYSVGAINITCFVQSPQYNPKNPVMHQHICFKGSNAPQIHFFYELNRGMF